MMREQPANVNLLLEVYVLPAAARLFLAGQLFQ